MALLAVLMTGALSFQMTFPLMLEPGERKIQKGGQSVGVAEEHQAHHRQEVFIAGAVGVGRRLSAALQSRFSMASMCSSWDMSVVVLVMLRWCQCAHAARCE
jgi:hypothetical protein